MALVITILVLALGSAACGVAGAFLLLGLGWALVVASAFLAAFALILRTGLANG